MKTPMWEYFWLFVFLTGFIPVPEIFAGIAFIHNGSLFSAANGAAFIHGAICIKADIELFEYWLPKIKRWREWTSPALDRFSLIENNKRQSIRFFAVVLAYIGITALMSVINLGKIAVFIYVRSKKSLIRYGLYFLLLGYAGRITIAHFGTSVIVKWAGRLGEFITQLF